MFNGPLEIPLNVFDFNNDVNMTSLSHVFCACVTWRRAMWESTQNGCRRVFIVYGSCFSNQNWGFRLHSLRPPPKSVGDFGHPDCRKPAQPTPSLRP